MWKCFLVFSSETEKNKSLLSLGLVFFFFPPNKISTFLVFWGVTLELKWEGEWKDLQRTQTLNIQIFKQWDSIQTVHDRPWGQGIFWVPVSVLCLSWPIHQLGFSHPFLSYGRNVPVVWFPLRKMYHRPWCSLLFSTSVGGTVSDSGDKGMGTMGLCGPGHRVLALHPWI